MFQAVVAAAAAASEHVVLGLESCSDSSGPQEFAEVAVAAFDSVCEAVDGPHEVLEFVLGADTFAGYAADDGNFAPEPRRGGCPQIGLLPAGDKHWRLEAHHVVTDSAGCAAAGEDSVHAADHPGRWLGLPATGVLAPKDVGWEVEAAGKYLFEAEGVELGPVGCAGAGASFGLALAHADVFGGCSEIAAEAKPEAEAAVDFRDNQSAHIAETVDLVAAVEAGVVAEKVVAAGVPVVEVDTAARTFALAVPAAVAVTEAAAVIGTAAGLHDAAVVVMKPAAVGHNAVG